MYNLGARTAKLVSDTRRKFLPLELEGAWPSMSEGMGLLYHEKYKPAVFGLLPSNITTAAKDVVNWGGRIKNDCSELALYLLRKDPSHKELLIQTTPPPQPERHFHTIFGTNFHTPAV